ncbi:NACHT, LRR and PYD domains-containing protein 12-like [Silurus asotus]|uniref:NACHT, LRR and PYD domains-containing protein 12-like n=1 Tax=Silurus asotus TaxID=30991 RepID=A0AAD5FRK3_SILAS|nr:NACHT, LRR and PYD domains-containing protein 12-like [Silurus asotus]
MVCIKLQREKSHLPVPSCVSMKSDNSMEVPLRFSTGISSPGHRHDPESTAADKFQKKFKFNLMKKFQCLNGLMLKQENRTLLNEIYTELYITEGDSGDVNKEHEGVAGIGKTVSVQKFVLDWAEGKTNQDVHLIFPLPFRELNLMKDQKLSLMELLHVFFKEMKKIDISRLEKVLFIFDGLDECRFPLDFQKTVRVCDVTESAPVHVLLVNLIKGNLLPSALIWITSRPAAADQIPSECVHRVTEVRGFNDPQKEEYFRKRINDQNLANKIITHLKPLRSLYIMCHIPVFCWISAAVLKRMLGIAESGEIPKTLTQMYTHFLIIQTNIIREKYLQKQESDEEMLLKLGKLAFQQLEKQNLIFYEEDLRECDIDVTEAAVYSGTFRSSVCAPDLYKEQRNVLKQNQVCRTLSDVHRSAVDQALKSHTGHLDLFLRFILGLSLGSNQKLLHSLVTQTGSSSQNKEETVQYIKKKISEDLPTEKSINLLHCLNELGDDSLVEEIQQYLKSGAQSELSPSQWSALVFVLLTSAQDLEEFDLNKYITPDKIRDEILVRVMPVMQHPGKAIIRCSDISGRSGEALSSVLNSETSSLRELHLTVNTLDLSRNKLEDLGVKRLSALLENPECKVKDLRLCDCGVSDEGCAAFASALRSNPSHLRKLDLSRNKVGDSGVKCLSAVLENPHCKLEKLSSPAKKVLLSNVPPFISDEAIVKELSRYGRTVFPIKKIPLGYSKRPGQEAAEPAGIIPPAASAQLASESPVTAAAPGSRECEPQAQSVDQRSNNDISTPEKPFSAKPDQENLCSAEPGPEKPYLAKLGLEKPCSAELDQEKPCSAELDLDRPCETEKVTVDSGAVLELEAPVPTPVQGDGGDVEMDDKPQFKVATKRKKRGRGQGKKQAKKVVKVDEPESDSKDTMSDSVFNLDSQEELLNVLYGAEDIKVFKNHQVAKKHIS